MAIDYRAVAPVERLAVEFPMDRFEVAPAYLVRDGAYGHVFTSLL
jgi:hypothetical protein